MILSYLSYILGTATGGLLLYLLIGLAAALYTSDPVYWFVAFGAFLVDRASAEKTNIVVIDKEEYLKQEDKNDNP